MMRQNHWLELTEKIKRFSSWQDEDSHSQYVERLLRERRLVLETAQNKISALEHILDQIPQEKLIYTLIYTTDKAPNQLESVNALLGERGILFQQLTAAETRDKKTMLTALASFQTAKLGILTAKRVLDEGVNIPEISTAFILASTTVERQWIQRRGRILRKCAAVNKTHATLHDFLVLPPTIGVEEDLDTRTLVKHELTRVMEFARTARNSGKEDGAAATIHKVVNRYFGPNF